MALFGKETEQDQARVAAYTNWFQRQHPLALTAFVLSVFSLTHLGTVVVDTIAGIVLGVLAIRRIRQKRGDGGTGSEWVAWAAITIGVVSLVLAILIYFVLPAPQPRPS
jgi:hypothetical protein